MEDKYYLYRWIRVDKNTPFYIGIGTKTKDDLKYGMYTRANRPKKKNTIWEKIVSKSEFEIEIVLESNDYSFIKKKEIEFIALYGRIDLGTGILSNMTDGGEGTKNVIVSEHSRKLRSINAKGVKKSKESILKRTNTMRENNYRHSKEVLRKMSLTKSKAVLQFSLDGILIKEWSKVIIAAEELKINRFTIAIAANFKARKSFTAQNFIWIYTDDFINNNLEKFNIALQRVKEGKIKTFYTEETKNNIRKDFVEITNITKTEKIKILSLKYNINYSTVRSMVYDF